MCFVVRRRDGWGWVGGWVSWKFWVRGCPNTPPPPSRGGETVLDSGRGFPVYPLSAAVSISRPNMKKLCGCGLYAADLEKARQEHLKSAEHKSRIAASKHAGSKAGVLCNALVAGWLAGWLAPWGFPNSGWVGLVTHPIPPPCPPPPVDTHIPAPIAERLLCHRCRQIRNRQ